MKNKYLTSGRKLLAVFQYFYKSAPVVMIIADNFNLMKNLHLGKGKGNRSRKDYKTKYL